jgi:hypothetical protein
MTRLHGGIKAREIMYWRYMAFSEFNPLDKEASLCTSIPQFFFQLISLTCCQVREVCDVNERKSRYGPSCKRLDWW